jgi:hypothetical protein
MGGPGVGIEGDPGDLNSERTREYWHAHMNTVAGNEALVIDAASRYPGVNSYGLNPGLVKSDIRSHFLGVGSVKHRLVEGAIGVLFGGPPKYAENIAPLLVSPDIELFSGAMFNKRGEAIELSSVMTDNSYVQRFMEASEQLAEKALSTEHHVQVLT